MDCLEDTIVEKLLLNFNNSFSLFIDYLNELTGLFTIIMLNKEKMYLFGDCAGMQSSYYDISHNNINISSHFQLIADLNNYIIDDYISKLMNCKFYHYYGPFLPGDLSAYKEIKRLVPNTYIDINLNNNSCEISRFYPYNEDKYKDYAYDELIEKISTTLHNNMVLISKKWAKPAISLTGGMDSKTTLACSNGLYDKFSYFSYISMDGEKIDALAANKICKSLGLKHRIYNINYDVNDVDFQNTKAVINHNFGQIGLPNDNDVAKRMFFKDTNDFDVEVKSWVSEIGRANYYKKFGKRKMPGHLTPKQMTCMYKLFITNRKLYKHTTKVFKDYCAKINFGSFPKKYDESDMFLWEVRYGGWGGLVITGEHRYSFDITIPYNNRELLDMFLSLPINSRISDKVHNDIILYMNKKIYDTGITITNYNETKKRMLLEKAYFDINSKL